MVCEDVSDWYTLLVLMLHIKEDTFWHADLAFLFTVAANYNAYKAYQRESLVRELERRSG